VSEVEWRAIPGYEGLYEVSSGGEVRSLERLSIRGVRVKPRVMRLQPNPRGGHLQVDLHDQEGKRRMAKVHQLVMLAFVGPCPSGHEVLHGDGIPANNRLSNLSYGTKSQNRFDRVRHGTDHNAAKTHCIRGHEFTEENTLVKQRKWRECRKCKASWYARNKKVAA
jgi:hypothetical protein